MAFDKIVRWETDRWRIASQNLLDRRALSGGAWPGVSAFVGRNLLGGFCFVRAWAPAVFRSRAKVCTLRLLNGLSLLVLSLELSSRGIPPTPHLPKSSVFSLASDFHSVSGPHRHAWLLQWSRRVPGWPRHLQFLPVFSLVLTLQIRFCLEIKRGCHT